MLPAIAVFAKAPVPGRVKTRLAATLGESEAADLYRRMVSTLLDRLTLASAGLAADIELHTDIPTDAWRAHTVSHHLQSPGDLGQRMLHTLTSGLAAGRPRLFILGGDVPTVPIPHIAGLLNAPEDIALGPAEDGGYWGISARRTHPLMFHNVEWSTPLACRQTAEACRRAGLSVSLGALWFDIDVESDLARI